MPCHALPPVVDNVREVNRLLDEAAQSADMKARYALYQRAEGIIVDDAPWIFLGHKFQILVEASNQMEIPIFRPCDMKNAWT